MTAYLNSDSALSGSFIVPPGVELAISIGGEHPTPIRFVENGGSPWASIEGDFLVLQNFNLSEGTAGHLDLPESLGAGKLTVSVHQMGQGDALYRLINWSVIR